VDNPRWGVPLSQAEGYLGGVIQVRVGHVVHTEADGAISFGRSVSCTIKLDAGRPDPQLSRIMGTFRREVDLWLLYNDSDRLDLEIDVDGGLLSVIRPGAWPVTLLPGSAGRVTVQTTRQHVVTFSVSPDPSRLLSGIAVDPLTGEPTTEAMATALKLNKTERTMLAALCEARLRNHRAGPWVVPSTTAVCIRLDITARRAEDIIDSLAKKVSPYVPGLIGDNDARATNRRQLIADFALWTKCVTSADLRLLP